MQPPTLHRFALRCALLVLPIACDAQQQPVTVEVHAAPEEEPSPAQRQRNADLLLHGDHKFAEAGAAPGYHCLLTALGQCAESSMTSASCSKQGGVMASGPCPTDGALGTCRYPAEKAALLTYRGNLLNRNAIDARSYCEAIQLPRGTWEPGEAATTAPTRTLPSPAQSVERCLYKTSCRDYAIARGRCDPPELGTEPCPTRDRVGSCIWADGMTEHFYQPSWDAITARTKCLGPPELALPGREGMDGFFVADPAGASGTPAAIHR